MRKVIGQGCGSGNCEGNVVSRTLRHKENDAILGIHAKLRSKVAYGQEAYQPTADYMRKWFFFIFSAQKLLLTCTCTKAKQSKGGLILSKPQPNLNKGWV